MANLWSKIAKKLWSYWFFGHAMAKKQNFKNRYFIFVEYYTGKVHSKFQVPNMFAVLINVPLVKFQYCDLKVLRILYLQDCQTIKTQARNNIFHADFCITYISTKSSEITQLDFGPKIFLLIPK